MTGPPNNLMSGSIVSPKPLSERPVGYGLAVLGGLPGAPVGLIASPAILFLLNKLMQSKNDKQPNRFATWALLGIVGLPLSMLISFSAFQSTPQQRSGSTAQGGSESIDSRQERSTPTSISAGDFSLSNVRVEPYNGNTKGADVAGELWVVYASVTNNSKETKIPGYSISTEVRDSQGRTFKAADFAVTSNSIFQESFQGQKVTRFSDGILPGTTREDVQVGVFDIAPGAQDLRLCVGAMFSGTSCF